MYKDDRKRKIRKRLNKVVRKSDNKATGKVGITIRNVDILKIDFKDMLLMTIIMIPFFVALNCILGIRTLDIKVLQEMKYAFTLAPIISSFILIPLIYLILFYLKHKDLVHKKSFITVLIVTISLVVILLEIRSYLSKIVLFNFQSYFLMIIIAIIIIVYYLIKIRKVFRTKNLR